MSVREISRHLSAEYGYLEEGVVGSLSSRLSSRHTVMRRRKVDRIFPSTARGNRFR